MAELLSYMVEKYGLLPNNSFGGRAGRSCTNSLMVNVDWIHKKWREGKLVSGLFLNISGVFPNTVIPALIHNMRKQRIPAELTDWIMRQNDGRTTRLSFDGFKLASFSVRNGVDQGNPLRMPLYGF